MSHPGHLIENLTLFCRLLRRLGIEVGLEQTLALVEATAHIELGRRSEVEAAALALLVHRRDQIALFRRAFDLFWSAEAFKPRRRLDFGKLLRRLSRQQPQVLSLPSATGETQEGDEDQPVIDKRQGFSASEVLRRKDFAELDEHELQAVRALLRERPWQVEPRRTRRRVAAPSGPFLDLRRTLRRSLRHGGEVIDLAWRRRRMRPRPVVVLCDISGSMEAYARIFLQFIYTLGAVTPRLEAFVFATRLTRISRQLAQKDIDLALRQAADQIVDWGGGTRIGESFRRFNYDWGRRVLGRGAVVVVLSDAWDRGDVELLERETARLRRSCERLLWLNPLLGSPGYQPLTRGIRQVLPYIDDFLPVHNLASLEQLGRALRKLSRATRGVKPPWRGARHAPPRDARRPG